MVLILAAEQERKGRTKRWLNFCFCSNYLFARCERNTSSTGTAVCSSPAPDWELVKDPVSTEQPNQLPSTPVTRTIEASPLWFGFIAFCFHVRTVGLNWRVVVLVVVVERMIPESCDLDALLFFVCLFTRRNKNRFVWQKNACGFCLGGMWFCWFLFLKVLLWELQPSSHSTPLCRDGRNA